MVTSMVEAILVEVVPVETVQALVAALTLVATMPAQVLARQP